MQKLLIDALDRYCRRTGHALERPAVVMFDMDGILFDSMPGHCKAWKAVCDEYGIRADEDEFYIAEGRTGASTIDILYRRQFGRPATEEEIRTMYARKCDVFKALGDPALIPGADAATAVVRSAGVRCVLVTGSGQHSNLDRLDREFPSVFTLGQRVTAFDVRHGKPDPEPYLIGMSKVGAKPWRAVGIDNAPLGVESSSRSGAFTIGVRTGLLPQGALSAAGADIELNSMVECAEILSLLFIRK